MATVKYLDENGLSTVWSKVKGIVTPKADKVSGATAGHLAGLNSGGNLVDSGLAADNIAQKDGSYSGMTVGAAEDLVSAESVASEFTSRITGGSTAVGKGGTALVDKIKGRTLVWNQQVLPLYNITFGTGLIISIGPDGKISLSGSISTPGGRTSYVSSDTYKIHIITGHKYICICSAPSGITPYVTKPSDASTTLAILPNGIAQATSTFDGRLGFHYSAGDYTGVSFYVSIIDSTLMFGTGNEPSTFAEFEALYPGPYYAYNPGELINNGLQSEYDLVWNQMSQGVSGGSLYYDSTTHIYYASGTRTYGEAGVESSSFVAGHIYCGKAIVKKDTGSKLQAILVQAGGGSKQGLLFSGINGTGTYLAYGQSPNSGEFRVLATFGSSSVTFDIEFSLNVFDLTVMFGAGNEPATPEEFEAMFPADYYPYDAGTEQHFSFPQFKTKIETVGWNIWDGVLESGYWNTNDGSAAAGSNWVRSKNPMAVLPSTNYYLKVANASLASFGYLLFYDAGMNYITYSNTTYITNSIHTTPANCRYVHFYMSSKFSAADVCFSLSDTSRNGTYEPYWRSELELGLGDIKVKSHNLWDEEWETGTISQSTGANQADSTRIRSKNYIPVNPGDKLYFYGASRYVYYWIFYYDSNRQFIVGSNDGSTGYKNNININNIGTVPANARYLRFYCASQTNTYQNDICINLSDPAFDGRYEPYGDGGVISITGGLKSAGTVYDEISGGKLIKRVDSYDLSGRSWGYSTSTTNPRFTLATGVSCVEAFAVNNRYINYDSYITLVSTSSSDKGVFLAGSGNLSIVDKSFSDATTFGTSMSGVMLYYALANPIEYELADALPTAMRNDPYGTERRLPEDTAAIVTAPFRADITYATNIKEAVQSMHQNFINVNSMQDFLAELGTLMGGTWTMRPADGKFDFTFTPNPVEPTL